MRKFIFLFICGFLISSCKKEDDVTVQFNIVSTGKTANGRNYEIDPTKTKIFFSNFKYVDSDGNEKLVKDVFLQKNGDYNFSFKVPSGNYSSFKFSFGLDATTNNSSPSSYKASNPLSVEEGMYWDMLKYRFFIIEGKIDDSPTKDESPDAPFSMHLGRDALYTEITASSLPLKGALLQIELDMDSLFVLDSDPFQITNFSNHSEIGEQSNGIAIKNSFVNGIKTTVVYPE